MNNLPILFGKSIDFCNNCLENIVPCFYHFKIEDINCLSIYNYDDKIKEFLYQLKGCYDIEIAPLFLCRFYRELSIEYYGYCIVPIPSWKDDDKIREFNHVVEIFKLLKLKMINCLYKDKKYKQSDQKKNGRNKIQKVLKMSNVENLKNKKILLVDDVCTTGSTLTAAIHLLKGAGVKKIKVLVIAKVMEKE